MSVVGDRCEADRDTEQVVGLVGEWLRRVRELLLPAERARSKSRERNGARRVLAALIATSLAGVVLVVLAPVAGASTSTATATSVVGIIPFPGDVYVLNSEGALIPVDPSSTPASAPLFNLAGDAMNVTWGQFSSATATSDAESVANNGSDYYTDFQIALSGLIPGGVYSLFYRTFNPDSNNSACPNVEPTVALTSRLPQTQQPDPDSFIASSSGGAVFDARVAGDLLAAQQLLVSVIYHFDGHTYGPVPNQAESEGPQANGECRSSYGIDAMRQFLIVQTANPAPSASIATPSDGATYAPGQIVGASYSCTEGYGGPGLSSSNGCVGPVASGSPIDTSTPGTHTFTVTATSQGGETGALTNTYTVAAPLNPGSTSCNGVYGGSGRTVTVTSGDVCTLIAGTKVTGDVQVQQGGALDDQGATIGGNLQVTDADWIELAGGATISGNLHLRGLTGAPPASDDYLCNTTVGRNVTVRDDASGAPIDIGDLGACSGGPGLTIGGNLHVHNNAADVTVGDNTVAGNIAIRNNAAEVTATANIAKGNIDVNRNTVGGGTLTGNSAGASCRLDHDNPPIAGSGNVAGNGHQNSCNTTA